MTLVERFLRRYYRWSSLRFCCRPVEVRCQRSLISFSFDDFPHSAATAGSRVLNELGIRGTYFVSFGFAERPDPPFTWDDVHHVVQNGHELGCHTYGHELSHRTRPRMYEESIDRNRQQFKKLEIDSPWRVFAYPAGSVTPRAKRMVQSRFTCGRGTLPGVNAGRCDRNMLKANSLYSLQRPVSHHVRLIEAAAEQQGWLVFYTHDVADHPSRFGCTPDYLRAVAMAAVRSGAQIMPIGESMKWIVEHPAIAAFD